MYFLLKTCKCRAGVGLRFGRQRESLTTLKYQWNAQVILMAIKVTLNSYFHKDQEEVSRQNFTHTL